MSWMNKILLVGISEVSCYFLAWKTMSVSETTCQGHHLLGQYLGRVSAYHQSSHKRGQPTLSCGTKMITDPSKISTRPRDKSLIKAAPPCWFFPRGTDATTSGIKSLVWVWVWARVHRLSPNQNCRHIVDDIFKCIFLIKKCRALIKILLKFVLLKSNWQYPSIGLEIGLAPKRRQTELKLSRFTDAYMRH